MRACPQPIIALVHGAACGGGFSLALAADIRIAGESARMNAAYIRAGFSACDMGCSYFLPRLVGLSVASELMMTGNFIEAERALHTGLVSKVVPDADMRSAPWAAPLPGGHRCFLPMPQTAGRRKRPSWRSATRCTGMPEGRG